MEKLPTLMEVQEVVKRGGDALKQLNKEVADYLDTLKLSEEAREAIAGTDMAAMAETFGGLYSEKEVEDFVSEYYL